MMNGFWFGLCLALVVPAAAIAQEKDPANYPITIARTRSHECITGAVVIGGQPVCLTFETASSGISVPSGSYIAVLRQNPKQKRVILEIPELNGAIIRLGDFPATANNHVHLTEVLKGCGSQSLASAMKGYEDLTMALKKGGFATGQKVSLAITLEQ